MIIEDPDRFKAWLTAKLGPLCDADPEALAKYVYALVKKDKPLEELRASMVGQLEVFLQRETQNFVSFLFRSLETQKFDLPSENAPVPAPGSPSAAKVAEIGVELREPPPPAVGLPEEAERKSLKETSSGGILATIASSAQNSNSLGCVLLAASNRRDTDKHIRKSESDKDERPPPPPSRRVRRRGSSPSPDRRRSRSRSFDRRRSRSRERERGRAWRNKSPPPRRYERSRRSFSKSPQPRRLKSGSPQVKRISRRSYSKSPHRRYSSRSPQGKRTKYRNRSPPHSRSWTRSRSRSPLGGRDRKDVAIGLSPRENSHGDTDTRGLQSVVNLTDVQGPYTRRCRDFDEQGFCIRGDLCPYDHGADPVVLEDVQMYNGGGGPPPAPPVIPPPGGPPPLMRHPVHPGMRPPPPSINLTAEYNPDAPSMDARMWSRPPMFRGQMMRGMMRGMGGRGGFPPQRDLINCVTAIPPFRHQRPLMNSMNDYGNGRIPNPDGKPFDFNRLGGGGPRQPFSGKGSNASLQLKKVPPGVNNITHLNSHFSKFGKIVNIQVGFEGDPESALITFSTPTEANIAYKSTEAVLNNRFIRVFWYNPDYANNANNENKQENAPPTTRPSIMERLGDHPAKVPLNNIQPSAVQPEEKTQVTLGVNNSLSKTLYIPSAMKKDQPKEKPAEKDQTAQENKTQEVNEVLMKKIELVAVAKKKQQESIKAGMKLHADLRKRKTELMEKQINEQKLLIQRLEAPNVTPQQKTALMDTIKTIQESIDGLRKDLELSVKAIAPNIVKPVAPVAALVTNPTANPAIVKKTREETQRELLDAELDLINSQNEGKDADELRKKVADLKMRAYSLGLPATRGAAFRGRGAPGRIRGRGRGAKFLSKVSYDHNVVDHRPTKVLVSGYEQDDKADVITHFEKFGQIVDYISDDATPSLVLNFKFRKDAENAINKGRNFSDRLLSVTWATSNMNIRKGVVTKPPTPVQRSVMVMEDDELGEELLDDVDDDESYLALSPVYFPTEGEMEEGEDEEEDERSWKR
ncbi:RRM [Nesidiocoris tenuis]|uniref:RRM n=1 Tax=Nesidiocoris tenuis TaxID=355587 RepID=A0ABN7A799_9HEMI|nr:RRM [Nesidiocoris tenuis]